jgi:hypothetical protein
MVGDIERRVLELRFIEGVEKVEHVPYPTGDQFWVRFNTPLDFDRLYDIVEKHGDVMVPFATLISKLPRGLSEMLWDGVAYVIAKKMSGWSKFTSSLGLEPEGIAKLANDLHGPYQIFIATEEEGVQLIYEYLGVKYTPPAPPPPVAQAKPPAPAPAAPRPAPVAPRPTTPTPPTPAKPAAPIPPAPTQPTASRPVATPPKPAVAQRSEKDETTQTTG